MSFLGVCAVSFADDNRGGEGSVGGAAVTHSTATRGQVMCTAAINADGSVASCFNCNKDVTETLKLSTGTYQVAFQGICDNAQASKGWSRWVQVDTLTDGTQNAYCTTADRAGKPKAVWVQCRDHDGAYVDASFFLFLAR